MFDQNTADRLYKEKLWFDLSTHIISSSKQHPDDSLNAFKSYILPNTTKIHPTTFVNTTITLSNFLPPVKSQELINTVIEIFEKIQYPNTDHTRALTLLRIKYNENCIFLGETNHVESFIYDQKSLSMDRPTRCAFYKMCYFFYEKESNIEELYIYLKKYIDMDDKNESLYVDTPALQAYKLVRAALLSKDVYAFVEVSTSRIFPHLQDEKLNVLFDRVKSGDYVYVNEHEDEVNEMLSGAFRFVREKVYLVAFVNVCFYSEKEISFESVKHLLCVEREFVLYLIIKAMGKNLVKGTVDGEKEVLKINYVMPRILSEEDLCELKNKYENWKGRICKVIQMI
ncbi:26S proteasome non-ATPase regulatory subunit 13 [Conglomerata obtusa]